MYTWLVGIEIKTFHHIKAGCIEECRGHSDTVLKSVCLMVQPDRVQLCVSERYLKLNRIKFNPQKIDSPARGFTFRPLRVARGFTFRPLRVCLLTLCVDRIKKDLIRFNSKQMTHFITKHTVTNEQDNKPDVRVTGSCLLWPLKTNDKPYRV